MGGRRIICNLKGWQRCEWEGKAKEVGQVGGMVQGQTQRQK